MSEMEDYNMEDLTESNYDNYYDNIEEDCSNKDLIYDGIQGDVKFLKQDQLLAERETLISEASENLCISREEATLALIFYKWSIENLNDKWFEEIEQGKKNCGLIPNDKSLNDLKLNRVESNGNFCLICYDSKTPENSSDFFSLSCGHQFCKSCWADYLFEKSKLFGGVLEVTCPQEGCSCKVYESLYFKYLTDTDALNRVKKGIIKNYIENNSEIKYCPNPKCEYCIRSSLIPKDVTCICKTSFCFKCNQESHKPCSCEMYAKWKKKLGDSDNEDDLWIRANTKECPHCHQRIEKSQGCNYMLCDKKVGGCGKAFCYVCSNDWAKHTQDHFSCNKYTEEVKKMEKKADILKVYLKRLDFYSTRYLNYINAVKYCDKKLRGKLKEKMHLLMEEKNIPSIELYFIEEALEAVITGKRSLSNTYIFGFYLKNGKSKEFFEFKQGLLEKNSEDLNRLLENDDLNDIIKCSNYSQSSEMLISYRNKILNLKNSILKYKDNLIQEIEDKYLGEIDMEIYNNEMGKI